MFTVTESKPPFDYAAAYARTIQRRADSIAEGGRRPTVYELMSLVYCNVKLLLSAPEGERPGLEEYDACLLILACLIPRQFMTTFPITKDFDGHKYGCKDYFYTLEELNRLPPDEPIGEAIQDLLWDYMNDDTHDFLINMLMCASDMKKAIDGKGIAEEWCEQQGITMYREHKDATTGQRFMVGTDGKSFPVSTPVPRGWAIMEGGA